MTRLVQSFFVVVQLWAAALASLDPNMVGDRDVMVNLMAWKWTDIANECESFLGPNGYGGVQISPPNEHAVVDDPFRPWWERYMPVSYELVSRSGTEDELRDMVKRCNEAGVRIYADAVINHMANGVMSKGSAGTEYDPKTLSYLQVPYAAPDFSVHNEKCPTESGGIEDFKNVKEVRDCNLGGRPDLDTSVNHVRHSISEYMNKLIDIGVAGFRVSNAENIWPYDLEVIYKPLRDLSTVFFEPGSRPFLFQEVNTPAWDSATTLEYLKLGRVTEFNYGKIVSRAINGSEKSLAALEDLEEDFPLIPSSGSLIFVDSPYTQRTSKDVVSYKEPRLYLLANAFMLAHPYGLARVMSSYEFNSNDQGPPSDDSGKILEPSIKKDGSCDNGWVCEHRWIGIKNMIGFRRASEGHPLLNWWSNDHQQIAFGRGDRAFIVFNNEGEGFSKSLATGLPEGDYCDIISGDFDPQSLQCTGQIVSVDAEGFASFHLPKDGSPVAAIHVNAMLPRKDSQDQEPSNPTTAATNPSGVPDVKHTFKRTTIFIQKETAFGQYLFIRGGVTQDECTDKASTSTCAVPMSHVTPGNNTQYNSWKTGDDYLDWYGAEEGQHSYQDRPAEGTPLVWTTNDPNYPESVEKEGYGYAALNQWGSSYWMVDLEMDCARTQDGWFELKGFLMNGQGWEGDVSQNDTCKGSAGGSKPSQGGNHFARCGFINVFKFGESECIINEYTQEGSGQTETPKLPLTPPPSLPPSPPPSHSETLPDISPSSSPTAHIPSVVTSKPDVPSSAQIERTTIFLHKETSFGQYLFLRGGLTEDSCTNDAKTSACAIPITHLTPGNNTQYNTWKTGDNYLDWYGVEEGQQSYQDTPAEGTPLVWTTNDPNYPESVEKEGYGYAPLNQWGSGYWMVDLEMDCARTQDGWFDLKGFLMNGQGWEGDVSQNDICKGSAGGSKPSQGGNHFARCGFINVFKFGESECIINEYTQEGSGQTETPKLPLTPPPSLPPSPPPSHSETLPDISPSSSPTAHIPSVVTSKPDVPSSAQIERTTIFLHKETSFGQYLFLRGGLTEDSCTNDAKTSACAIPITHLTPGNNTQYNTWKTGDNYLDWYGVEEGQQSYQDTPAEGTPLVWTTNDPNYPESVEKEGYGYAPLNQWGSGYWMVDLEMDCARTQDGWFDLKGFLMNGQGWEGDVSQNDICKGSAGGSKPSQGGNHFARCGFINVFKFGESECIINEYTQEGSGQTKTPKLPPTPPPSLPPSPPPSPPPSHSDTPPDISPSSSPTAHIPSVVTSKPDVPSSAQIARTTIFLHKDTSFGQYLFLRGGLTEDSCTNDAKTSVCAIPITRLTPGNNTQYNTWKTGDNYLDWYGVEEGQQSYQDTPAEGTPLVWTTNDPNYPESVEKEGYGYAALNQWGSGYWMADLEMDCARTQNGWFELKGFLMNGQGWEGDVSQNETCKGSAGGSKPSQGGNHFARCGFINVFKFGESECIINEYTQEGSGQTQTETPKLPPTPPPTLPPSPPPSHSETSPNTSQSSSPTEHIPSVVTSKPDVPSAQIKRTTILLHKDTTFGQYLFLRGGLTEDSCTNDAKTSACAIPITHLTPGNNTQYNTWKTGDNYLDWYGVEDGQQSYQDTPAEGTPLVWTTNDPNYPESVEKEGYGYAALNQWGSGYWMADLEMDCARTQNGWFELKGFLMNGQGWEGDVSQNDTCKGSAGGSKPPQGGNHFAMCGFINVFKFGESECIINNYVGEIPEPEIPPEIQAKLPQTPDIKPQSKSPTSLVNSLLDKTSKDKAEQTEQVTNAPTNPEPEIPSEIQAKLPQTSDIKPQSKSPSSVINSLIGETSKDKAEQTDIEENSRDIQGEDGYPQTTSAPDNPTTDIVATTLKHVFTPTVIFLRTSTYYGQYVFIRGGIDHDHRAGCTVNANSSACAIPIVHHTPGANVQYNAWKTGDYYLDWYGAEGGQYRSDGVRAEGTPLVWTTNDPTHRTTVDAEGYGYTPLNQWGSDYWMVRLGMDCSKTEDGWFELKGFITNANNGWEKDITQVKPCEGSAGGSKPYSNANHFARCGFVNVFEFNKNDFCIIDTLGARK